MSQGGPVRRPSPLAVLLVFLGACLAPVVMLLVTGLTGGPRTDRVRTADGGGGDERAGLEIVPDGEAESAPSTTTATAPEPVTPTPAGTTAAPTTAAPPSTVVPTTAVAPAPPPPPAPTTTTRPPAASPADRVVELVNAARAEAGCGPLATDERLARAAQGHADDMAAQGYCSHTSLDGRSFADRVRDAGHPRPGARRRPPPPGRREHRPGPAQRRGGPRGLDGLTRPPGQHPELRLHRHRRGREHGRVDLGPGLRVLTAAAPAAQGRGRVRRCS